MIDKKFEFDSHNIDIKGVDDALVSAVLICLFTNAYVAKEDLPYWVNQNGGWHGDVVPVKIDNVDKPLYSWGSRLWLLQREKITAETLVKAKEYAEDALLPLIEIGALFNANVNIEQVKEGINLLIKLETGEGNIILRLNNVVQGD